MKLKSKQGLSLSSSRIHTTSERFLKKSLLPLVLKSSFYSKVYHGVYSSSKFKRHHRGGRPAAFKHEGRAAGCWRGMRHGARRGLPSQKRQTSGAHGRPPAGGRQYGRGLMAGCARFAIRRIPASDMLICRSTHITMEDLK